MQEYKQFYRGKRVLVTGGAGAVGSRLTRVLLELDAEVVVLDNLSSSYLWNLPDHENLLFVEGNVADEVDLKRVFREDPGVLFHLAAFFANQNSIDFPEKDLMTNGFGTLRLFEYCALKGDIERVIYASSGCSIYGNSTDFPLKENDISLDLSTPYQVTKMLGELYGNFYKKQYDLPIVKARFFNSFGPGEVPGQYRNVIPNFIYWSKMGRPLPITGSGEETRDFTYVDDIVDGLLRSGFYEDAVGESFNFCSGSETQIIELAERVNELTKNGSGIEKKPRRKWDTKRRILGSYEKAQNLIGYEPDFDFDEGLQKTVEWFDSNWSDIKRTAEFGPGTSSAVRNEDMKQS